MTARAGGVVAVRGHPLPHRRGAVGVGPRPVRQRRHVGRRVGRRRAEDVGQYPPAPEHRRRPHRVRGDGQDAALPEQPAPVPAHRHPAEVASLHVGNAVVPRESIVDERVVGVEQVEDAAVLAHDALEEQLRLAAERLPQPVVEVGEEHLRRPRRLQVPELQPLADEVVGQGPGAVVGQHPAHLPPELSGVGQRAARRRVEQLVVGHAAPEEERQPRRQLEVGDAVVAAGRGRGVRRIGLDPEQELGAHQQLLQRALDAGLEAAGLAPRRVGDAQDPEVGVVDRPAPRPPGQGRENGVGAGRLLVGVRGPAHEEALAGRGVAGARRVERPGDRDAAQVGQLPAAHRRVQEEAARGLRQQGRGLEERDPDLAGAGRDGQPHLEVVAHLVPVDVERRQPLQHAEQLDPLAVDGHLELRPARHPRHVDPQHVLGVEREPMGDQRAAAGPVGQALDVIVLRQGGRDGVGAGHRRRRRRAHRGAADAPGRGQVALHERFRHAQNAGDVVEPVARAVGGQELLDVDGDAEHVADRVPVLGAVEPMEGLGAAGVRRGRRRGVELGLEPRRHAVVGGLVGARPPRRGHQPRAQLPDHHLPQLGVVADPRHVDVVEGEPGGERAAVVAGDAVAPDHGAGRLGRVGGLRGRLAHDGRLGPGCRLGRCRRLGGRSRRQHRQHHGGDGRKPSAHGSPRHPRGKPRQAPRAPSNRDRTTPSAPTAGRHGSRRRRTYA